MFQMFRNYDLVSEMKIMVNNISAGLLKECIYLFQKVKTLSRGFSECVPV